MIAYVVWMFDGELAAGPNPLHNLWIIIVSLSIYLMVLILLIDVCLLVSILPRYSVDHFWTSTYLWVLAWFKLLKLVIICSWCNNSLLWICGADIIILLPFCTCYPICSGPISGSRGLNGSRGHSGLMIARRNPWINHTRIAQPLLLAHKWSIITFK